MVRLFRDFKPTAVDPAGNGPAEIQDWIVSRLTRSRDSDAQANSRFARRVRALGGEGPDLRILRFSHWGCGWFEIVVVRPDSEVAKKLETLDEDLNEC